MRICVVSVTSWVHGIGGMQDHTSELVRGLARLGHDVEVLTGRHPHRVSEARHEGATWHFLDAEGAFWRRDWQRASTDAFMRIHAEDPFDVVHGQGSGALGLVRAGVHRRVPTVVQFHGNYVGLVKAALRRMRDARHPWPVLREVRGLAWLSRRHFAGGNWYRFRGCDAIVGTRHYVVDATRAHCLRRDRVHLVPYGVDTDLFAPRPRSEARRELGLGPEPTFVCASRLNREKGIAHALRAYRRVRERHPEARLVVVGDGEERARLERLAADLGLGNGVAFAGQQPHDRLAAYCAAADAVLYPTERDDAPLMVLKAMACGAAVVTTEVGAIPDFVDPAATNALLVPPADAERLADAMSALLADPALRDRIGASARARVERAFSIETMARQTLAVYELAAGRRHGGAAEPLTLPGLAQ